jgi:flavin-dependent dehydrogenase
MGDASSYDCIVVGGGPAGATAATLLADFGHRVVVMERTQFPRHHIGESLMPQTYRTFERLGVLDKLRASASPRKESVQFISASGKESQPFYFTDRDPAEWSTTWQVRRDWFDRMMLENARDHGAEIRHGVSVGEVLFDGSQAIGVRTRSNGTPQDVFARVVVDATGMAALLPKQLNLQYPDGKLKNGAIYAYYENAVLDEGRNAGATLIIHTPSRNGWFWFIPLENGSASVGLVAPPTYLFSGRGDNPLLTLEEEIRNCPALSDRLAAAERTSGAYVTSDFSYRSRQMAGDGWVIIGDAFCFLDPVYSSGVMLALKSGEMAADAIHEALGAADVSGKRLGRFAAELVRGIQFLRQLVYAFYDPGFNFAEFVKQYPQFQDHLVRMLIGDVFSDDIGEIFDAMSKFTELPEPIPWEGAACQS